MFKFLKPYNDLKGADFHPKTQSFQALAAISCDKLKWVQVKHQPTIAHLSHFHLLSSRINRSNEVAAQVKSAKAKQNKKDSAINSESKFVIAIE